MHANRNFVRLVAVLVALVMLAAACSDDGGTNTSPFSPSSDDTGSGDSDGDTGSDDSGSDDTGSDGDTGADDDPSPIVVPGGDIDCVALGEAMSAAGGIVATDPSSGSAGDNLEQDFAESRAQFEALKVMAPEIADDVDAVLAGLDLLGEMFASFDWDTDTLAADPAQIAGYVAILGDPAFLALTPAFNNIALFIGNTCS